LLSYGSYGSLGKFRPVSEVPPNFGSFAQFQKFRPVSEISPVSDFAPNGETSFARFRKFRQGLNFGFARNISEHTLITKPEEPKDIKKRNKVSKEQSVRSGNKKRKKYLDCKTERDERETKEKRKLSDIN